MGTPEFAVPTLLEISKGGSAPVAVYTRAPARSGRRGLEIRRTPVHSAAEFSWDSCLHTDLLARGRDSEHF